MKMKSFFRILLSVLLILSLSLSVCTAIETSDKTYEAGKPYTLIEEKIDLSGLPVYAPASVADALGFPAGNQEGLVQIGTYEDIFADQPLTLQYASDDLSTLMFNGMVCLRNGRLIITYPSYTRGVEDTYGVFERVTNSAYFLRSASRSGMTFSSDGRYALYIDGYSALTRAQFDYQLFILDVEAGEWYLGYTWPRKLSEGAQCVVGACFDEKNEYIYIKAYGMSYYYNPNQFLRYHMETGEMEHLRTHELWHDYTNMFRTPDGCYVHGMRPMVYHQPSGLVAYKEIEGNWFAIPEYFHMQSQYLYIQNLDMKGENGQALVLSGLNVQSPLPEDIDWYSLNSNIANVQNILSLPVINNGVHGLREFILFDKELTQAKRVTIRELLESDLFKPTECFDYPRIYNAALSPDGKYAFVIFRIAEKFATENCFSACILNTETLGVSPVSYEEGDIGLKSAFGSAYNADYPVGIRFIANDLIIINTDDGIRLFRIR